MAENGNGNGKLGLFVSVVTSVIVITAAVVTPLWQAIASNSARLDKVEQWQEDYGRGKIPSSAEKEISQMREMFEGVEGQLGKSNATTNMGFSDVWRELQVIYKKLDGTEISIPNYWPEFGKKE